LAERKRLSFSSPGIAALVLFFWAAALGIAFVQRIDASGYVPYLTVLTVPVLATGLTLFALVVAPGLLPGGKIRFPANLTLPVLHIALMVACVVVGTSTGNALVMPNPTVTLLELWIMPGPLLVVGAMQIGTLSLLAATDK
jgi:hypothetical protein